MEGGDAGEGSRAASAARLFAARLFFPRFPASRQRLPPPPVCRCEHIAGQSEIDTFDCGQGHPTPTGEYHYHIAPFLVDKAQATMPGTQHSPLYGYLVDGVPVFGPNGDTGAPATGLDDCGGHSGDGGGLGYHYHTKAPDGVIPGPNELSSTANQLPYFAGCLAGCVADSGSGSGAQAETWADCVKSSTAAPMGTSPTYAGERNALAVPPASYNYTGCPASFLAEFEKENTDGGDVTGAAAAAASAATAVVALILALSA